MTKPPLTGPVTFWTIAIHHEDFFNDWSIKEKDEVCVSIRGYPTVRDPAVFRSEVEARRFLETNRKVLDRRCAVRIGFLAFNIREIRQYWPVEYDEVPQLRTVREAPRAS